MPETGIKGTLRRKENLEKLKAGIQNYKEGENNSLQASNNKNLHRRLVGDTGPWSEQEDRFLGFAKTLKPFKGRDTSKKPL